MKQARVLICCLTLFTLLSSGAWAVDSPSFRGAERNGVYNETGLLKSWPEEGPKQMWAFEGLGEGYASVAVHDGTVYTVGKTELAGFLFAIDKTGKLKWKVNYGAEAEGGGFPGSRSTPTIDDGLLFITTGPGSVLAFKQADGSKVWEKDIKTIFGGSSPRFDYSESVLIDGDNLICTPGGPDASVVALNKRTGETVWTSKGLSDKASYCSARIYKNGAVRQIITLTDTSMVGLAPKTGKLLWQVDYPIKYGIHANSPVFDGNTIYVSDGYKEGGRAFEIAADGNSVKEIWKEASLDIHHGGIVGWKGHAYGATTGNTWSCINLKSGEIVSTFKDIGKGSVILADGLLYGYDEKGRVGLINPDPANFSVISKFTISKGSAQHWGHPVISGGLLYIRHGDALMCYNIKAS